MVSSTFSTLTAIHRLGTSKVVPPAKFSPLNIQVVSMWAKHAQTNIAKIAQTPFTLKGTCLHSLGFCILGVAVIQIRKPEIILDYVSHPIISIYSYTKYYKIYFQKYSLNWRLLLKKFLLCCFFPDVILTDFLVSSLVSLNFQHDHVTGPL